MSELILVVDDDIDTLRLVGLMLKRQGYSILTASNGQQALKISQEEQPDLILLDIMMPDMDGYEVARQLRGNPDTSDIPIIMFTAKTQLDDKVSGFEAGADDYLTKPTQPRELFAHIKAVLTRSSKSRKKALPITPETVSERGKVIGVISAKGGVGVSTVALNLGICLRQKTQQNTIVAEFRPGQGTMSLSLGLVRPVNMNSLLELSAHELTLQEIKARLVPLDSGIKMLLSSYKPKDARYLSYADVFETIANKLGYLAKYVILDLGNTLSPIADQSANQCDLIITILEPTQASVTQTKELINALNAKGINQEKIKLVSLSRFQTEYLVPLDEVQETIGLPISVVITPAAEMMYRAEMNTTPIAIYQSTSSITRQLFELAGQVE